MVPNEDNRFFGASSIGGKNTNSRTLDEVIEGEAGRENTDLVKKWREALYKNQDEWNRDWKRRRRGGNKGKLGKRFPLCSAAATFSSFH